MWTSDQQAEFEARGLVRLPGAFSSGEAAAMEDRVWSALDAKHGVQRDDPATWEIPLASGLQGLRGHDVFAPIGGAATVGALDQLIGPGRWGRPKHWGQFLVSFPSRGADRTRSLWHTDFPFGLSTHRVAGALVFSFVGAVPSGGGGTLVVAGSHRVIANLVQARPALREARMKDARRALMASDPWLAALAADHDEGWVARVLGAAHTLDDVPIEVVELAGEAGDVIIGHPLLLHTPAPNRGDRPRFMRVQRIGPPRQFR